MCEPLSTPRPLGPVHDVAAQLGGRVQQLLRDEALPYDLFVALYEELREHDRIVVVDDTQWADEGSVDLLRFLVRRLPTTRSLVIVAYRDDEITPLHGLRPLLGDAARADGVLRLAPRPLSTAAVARMLEGRGLDAAQVHGVTGGNPFFVQEIATQPDPSSVPATIRDAVLARTVELDQRAREVLEILACSPGSIPATALTALSIDLPTLRRLDETGLVDEVERGVAFRHELCRRAILEALPPGGQVALHRRTLEALESAGVTDAAVLTHHALGAQDGPRIARHAEVAGRQAARSGAHSEAATFYRTALAHMDVADAARRASIMMLLAEELYLVDQLPQAIATCTEAMQLRRSVGDLAGVGAAHEALAVYEWYNANRQAADEHATAAVDVLGPAAEALRLAHAHATAAYLAVHQNDVDLARRHLASAARIAEEVDDTELHVRIGVISSVTGMLAGQVAPRGELLATIDRGLRDHLDDVSSEGYSNLAYLDVEQRRLEDAEHVLDVSLPLTVERDIPICNAWQLGVRGRLNLLRGRWSAAVEDAEEVMVGAAPLARTWPLVVRGLVALRRGDDSAREHLDAAWGLAVRFGEPLRLLPAGAALVERAWLTGDPEPRLDAIVTLLERFRGRVGTEWSAGDLAVWLRRIGCEVPDAIDVAEPYRLQLAGDHLAAAARWEQLESRYEQALALVDSGDAEAMQRGLGIIDLLDARAVGAKLRRDLRAGGVTGLPAQPRRRTQANPAGLTDRQLEVLRLLAEGLSNAELAQRLYISPKTADHHVSAILSRLQVRSRTEAAHMARRLGLIS